MLSLRFVNLVVIFPSVADMEIDLRRTAVGPSSVSGMSSSMDVTLCLRRSANVCGPTKDRYDTEYNDMGIYILAARWEDDLFRW